MKNLIIVTGGAGFVGSNLIDFNELLIFINVIIVAWQCPTLPCLKTKYHRRIKA